MFHVTVTGGSLPQNEVDAYLFYIKKKYGTALPDNLEITLEIDGDFLNIRYNPPFQFHAYRATDYLVNDTSKLNASKFAEFQDKIVHSVDR